MYRALILLGSSSLLLALPAIAADRVVQCKETQGAHDPVTLTFKPAVEVAGVTFAMAKILWGTQKLDPKSGSSNPEADAFYQKQYSDPKLTYTEFTFGGGLFTSADELMIDNALMNNGSQGHVEWTDFHGNFDDPNGQSEFSFMCSE